MSELKKGMELTPIKIMLKQPNTDGNVYPVPCLVYIKSEADKVIAKKDKEIAKLKEQVALLQAEFTKELGVQ